MCDAYILVCVLIGRAVFVMVSVKPFYTALVGTVRGVIKGVRCVRRARHQKSAERRGDH